MNVDTEILTILQDAKLQIQANLQRKNINASGRSSKSFEVRKTNRGFQLIMQSGDVAPAQTLEKGKKPSSVPVEKIKQWIIDKRMTINNIPYLTDREHKYTQDERNLNSAAWAVAEIIKKKGTIRYREPEEVIYSPVIEEVKKKIFPIVKNALISTIKEKQIK